MELGVGDQAVVGLRVVGWRLDILDLILRIRFDGRPCVSRATVTIATWPAARSRSATTTPPRAHGHGQGRRVQQRDDRPRRVVEADVQAGRHVLVPVRDPSRDDRQGRGQGNTAAANPEAEALPDAKACLEANRDRSRCRDPRLRVRPAEHQRSAGLDRHVAECRGRRPSHRDRRGRLVRLGDDRGRRVVGSHVRNGRHVHLRLCVPPADGGGGRSHCRRRRRRAARRRAALRIWDASIRRRRQRYRSPRRRLGRQSLRPRPNRRLPTEAASATAAVSTQGPTFGGELMVRFVIVGVLIGGAFLLFVRAVGGSVRRGPDEA